MTEDSTPDLMSASQPERLTLAPAAVKVPAGSVGLWWRHALETLTKQPLVIGVWLGYLVLLALPIILLGDQGPYFTMALVLPLAGVVLAAINHLDQGLGVQLGASFRQTLKRLLPLIILSVLTVVFIIFMSLMMLLYSNWLKTQMNAHPLETIRLMALASSAFYNGTVALYLFFCLYITRSLVVDAQTFFGAIGKTFGALFRNIVPALGVLVSVLVLFGIAFLPRFIMDGTLSAVIFGVLATIAGLLMFLLIHFSSKSVFRR